MRQNFRIITGYLIKIVKSMTPLAQRKTENQTTLGWGLEPMLDTRQEPYRSVFAINQMLSEQNLEAVMP